MALLVPISMQRLKNFQPTQIPIGDQLLMANEKEVLEVNSWKEYCMNKSGKMSIESFRRLKFHQCKNQLLTRITTYQISFHQNQF